MRAGRTLVAGLAALALAGVLGGCGGAADGAADAAGPEADQAAAGRTPAEDLGEGRSVAETVPTPSLANNILGDPAERDVVVHLPPTYDTSDARYAVVYYLAGADEPVGRLRSLAPVLWSEMGKEGMRELIVVELDGESSMGNTFYANSPVTGNAEDALTQDLVAYVDATYRTIPEAASRGLSGFSMGGSGAINVGLAHPEVFGALYAASPGLFRPADGLAGFLADNGAWDCYGAAFAPAPQAPYPHHLPIDPRAPLSAQDPAAVAAWESGYGDLERKVADYLAQPERLAAIRIAYGTADGYRWIPEGSEYLLGLLAEDGIPASSNVFTGGHTLDTGFPGDLVAFFSANLAG